MTSWARPSARLLKAKPLQALYPIRSEVEALAYNLLFRCFRDHTLSPPIWDTSTCSQKQNRQLQPRTPEPFFARSGGPTRTRLGERHPLHRGQPAIEAWARLKSFPPKTGARTQPTASAATQAGTSTALRSNATHASTTDRKTRRLRNGKGKEVAVTSATGVTGSAAATELLPWQQT
jgi:hypothetical protein